MLSDHSGIKLETNNQKIAEKILLNVWKLNNILLNNSSVKEEIPLDKLKKIFEAIENEIIPYQNL